VVLPPADATKVADAIVRVFVESGDRTNRTKARLKYVLDDWGFDRFLAAVEEKLGRKLDRVDTAHVKPRAQADCMAHLGVHKQRQEGLNWIGLVLPVGKLTVAQMKGIAGLARELGDGDIRLTVWQNLLVSGVSDDDVPAALRRIEALGLSAKATAIRAGLVACTGNTGCKFAAANTKGTAAAIADHVESTLELDQPVNIHLTGCHHSCAQHYIGDIGLIACQVPVDDDGDTVEGFHIVVGGGTGANAKIGRELTRDVKKEDCPQKVEQLLRTYLAHRESPEEPFFAFANRHEVEQLNRLVEAQGA
jgi:ferredoxin-nitrite reductase